MTDLAIGTGASIVDAMEGLPGIDTGEASALAVLRTELATVRRDYSSALDSAHADSGRLVEENETLRGTVDSLRADVESLRETIESLRASLRGAHERHGADIEMIGERLLRQAERRDWCHEFDDVVSELNGSLHVSLPTRVRDYGVTFTVTYYVTVEASDAEDAESTVYDSWQSYAHHGSANDVDRSDFDAEECD